MDHQEELTARYRGLPTPATLAQWRAGSRGAIDVKMSDIVAWQEEQQDKPPSPPAT